jgi:hypothetical protein
MAAAKALASPIPRACGSTITVEENTTRLEVHSSLFNVLHDQEQTAQSQQSSNRDQTELCPLTTLDGNEVPRPETMPHEVNYRPKSRRASRMADIYGRDYGAPHESPDFGSDNGKSEQQVRSEPEAETWPVLRRNLRETPHVNTPIDYNNTGSATLKALVRFGLATFGAHVAWLVAVAFQLGQFEIWLAMAAGFVITLALSMFGYARGLVNMLAEAARWILVSAVALSALWLAFQLLR